MSTRIERAGGDAPLEAEVAARTQPRTLAALRKGYRWIAAVTWLYRFAALGYGFGTIAAIAALGATEVPLRGGLQVVVQFAVMTVFLLASAIRILFQPFLWTVITAALASLVFVLHLRGPNPLDAAHYWSLAWAVVFWLATVPTFRMQRLMAEHQDLYILHHSSRATQRAVRRRSPEQRHARLLAVMRRASGRAWRVSAAVAVAAVVATAGASWMVLDGVRPEEHAAAVADFEEAWNRGDDAALGARFHPQVRAEKLAWLRGVGEGHGWGDQRPDLGGASLGEDADGTWARYELDVLSLEVGWALYDRTWLVVDLELPVPPLEPLLDRFLDAWRRSDLEDVAALYGPEHAEAMLPSIRNSVELRGWDPLPEVAVRETRNREGGEAVVLLGVEGETLTSEWRVSGDGRWRLQALRFPERRRRR